jgi:chemotaxis protein histidine kinase CheA
VAAKEAKEAAAEKAAQKEAVAKKAAAKEAAAEKAAAEKAAAEVWAPLQEPVAKKAAAKEAAAEKAAAHEPKSQLGATVALSSSLSNRDPSGDALYSSSLLAVQEERAAQEERESIWTSERTDEEIARFLAASYEPAYKKENGEVDQAAEVLPPWHETPPAHEPNRAPGDALYSSSLMALQKECEQKKSAEKEDPEMEQRVADERAMVGPFLSPFTKAQHDIYKRWGYKVYSICESSDILPHAQYDESTAQRLDIGDTIQYENAIGRSIECKVWDFAKDEIIYGAYASQSVMFTEDALPTGFTRIRGAFQTYFQDPTRCWVRRNPNRTQSYLKTLQSGRRETIPDPDPVVQELMKTTDLVPRVIHGVGYGVDDEYRCIRNLPTTRRTVTFHGHHVLYDSDCTQRPCYICGRIVKTNCNMPEWTEIEDFKFKEREYRTMSDHCNDHHAKDMFFFCHNVTLQSPEGAPYTLRMHLQKTMRKVILQEHQLNYDLFLNALKYDNPRPLQFALARLFGMMAMEPISIKNIKAIKGYGQFPLKAVEKFQHSSKATVKELGELLRDFDYRTLLPSGKVWNESYQNNDRDVYQIWNATNLFLRRGLYDDEPFPAIRNQKIPETTLEEYKEEFEALQASREEEVLGRKAKKRKREPKAESKQKPKEKATATTKVEMENNDIVLPLAAAVGAEVGTTKADL